MTLTIDQGLGLAFGLVTFGYSIRVARVFLRLDQETARLIGWNLLGTATLTGVAVIFTVGGLMGCIQVWPDLFKSGLRFLMYGVPMITMVNLARRVD